LLLATLPLSLPTSAAPTAGPSPRHSGQLATPIFSDLNPRSKVIGLLAPGQARVVETRDGYLLKEPAMEGAWSPIRYYRDCARVVQGQIEGWVIDGIMIRDGYLAVDFGPELGFMPWVLLFFAAGLACAVALRHRFQSAADRRLFFEDRRTSGLALGGLIFLRLALAFLVLQYTSLFALCTTDEQGYFQVGQALFRTWDFSSCRFTVGWGAVHGLFAWLVGAESYEQVLLPLSFFNSVVVGSLICVLLHHVSWKITGRRSLALLGVTLWVVQPYVLQVLHRNTVVVRDYVGFPTASEYATRIFYWATTVGHNAFSDHPNVCIILLTTAVALHFFPLSNGERRRSVRGACVGGLAVGLLFGLSGAVRVTNILFAPALIYMVVGNVRTTEGLRGLFARLAAFAIGGVIGFSPQLVANVLQSGSLLVLPYHIHHPPEAHNGFSLAFLATGAPFVQNSISIPLSLAAAYFCGRRSAREKTLLLLFTFPALAFFSGYPYVVVNAVRWFMCVTPFLLICAIANGARDLVSGLAVLPLVLLFKHPAGGDWQRDVWFIAVLGAACGVSFANPVRRFCGAFRRVSLAQMSIVASGYVPSLCALYPLSILGSLAFSGWVRKHGNVDKRPRRPQGQQPQGAEPSG